MEARSFPFLELIPIVQSFLTTTSLSLVSSCRIEQRRHVLLPQSLYFKKTSIQVLRWNTGKDSNWNCVFHVGFVAIQSSIVLLSKENICPPSVGVILKSCQTRKVT